MSKKALALCALVLCALSLPASAGPVERVERGNLVMEGLPEIPDDVFERMRQYRNTRAASLQGWHPDGRGILISTRFGETNQIHHVEQPGGARRQLTFFKEPVFGANVSPNPRVNGFLFNKDVGGSEFYQIFFFDLETGTARMLTDGTSRNGGATWTNDGERFAYYTTRRNGRDWDLHMASVGGSGPSRPILEEEGTWVPVEFSPDDSTLLVVRYVSANESYPYVLELASGELHALHTSEEPISYSAATFAPDGKGIYFASDENSEFKRLQHHDLATGRREVLTADIPWNIGTIQVAEDGRHLAFTTNENGITKLYLKSLPDWKDVTLPELPLGQVYGLHFSKDGRRLGLVLNSARTPGDVFTVDVGTTRLTRWTRSEVGGLRADTFVMPELIHYETFDEVDGKPRTIPAFYYKPRGEGPHPVVINIHGGPEGQARPFFSATVQYWVNELGLAVLAPNVRGSSGYGKSYLKLDNGFQREESVKDIGKLLDWVEARPELDADRVAVYGGSYGGYMVLASMVHFSDRLRAGVDVVGISNFVTFLKNTQDYRRDLRRVEYGDERIPEMNAFLERISPSNHAEKITKPLFIVQGLNDPRVPATESEQMVREIRESGGTVWYLLAKDEGHGFRKKGNADTYQAAASLFLEEHLLRDGPVARAD